VNEKQKRQLFDIQRGLCWLCREPMRRPGSDADAWAATRGDAVERPLGVSTELANRKLVHRACNNGRTHGRKRKSGSPVVVIVADESAGALAYTYAWLKARRHFEANEPEDAPSPSGSSE
jgi:hypothetical protein